MFAASFLVSSLFKCKQSIVREIEIEIERETSLFWQGQRRRGRHWNYKGQRIK